MTKMIARIKSLGAALAVLLLVTIAGGGGTVAQAQTRVSFTTLAAAVTGITASTDTFTVASATGIAAGMVGYTDQEAVQVTTVNGTIISVNRGQYGTNKSLHKSGTVLFFGLSTVFRDSAAAYHGACTSTSQAYLPHIQFSTGLIQDCLGGVWVSGVGIGAGTPNPAAFIYAPNPGAVAYTSINTNGTALIATELYCTEVFVPTNRIVTGIKLLNGTTVGADNHYVVLYGPQGGAAMGNSALAGTITANGSTYQARALTTPVFAVGPSTYYACAQGNGTTDTLRMAITGVQDQILTKGQTGATFGTVPSLTAPTSFTTAVGPYVVLY